MPKLASKPAVMAKRKYTKLKFRKTPHPFFEIGSKEKPAPKKRVISAASREKMADAARKRWADKKATTEKGEEKPKSINELLTLALVALYAEEDKLQERLRLIEEAINTLEITQSEVGQNA